MTVGWAMAALPPPALVVLVVAGLTLAGLVLAGLAPAGPVLAELGRVSGIGCA
ncbi:hypothetical protein [Rhodopila sp.]|jgi:hypothetical protein|uniref:hypothetical protein n=1 Tax=Rhodopila sp. TaxID=2480087 RepID=UPI002CE2D346|nr:hypothetical protein [Rhodopila sp.]HVZ06995.1 hypothetical protein [Rhodopila sp.]